MENQRHNEPATFEEIRAIMREVSELQKENERERKEMQKETDRRLKETGQLIKDNARETKETKQLIKDTDRQMKDTDRRLQKLDELFNSQWSRLMESLVEGDLVALLQGRDIAVQRTLSRAHGRRNGAQFEFDILAVNGEEVVVVEVKTTLRAGDVTRFLGKLEEFTVYMPEYGGKRVYGAVAYLQAHESVQTHAARQGLFVIRATGGSASIVNDKEFRPRVFG